MSFCSSFIRVFVVVDKSARFCLNNLLDDLRICRSEPASAVWIRKWKFKKPHCQYFTLVEYSVWHRIWLIEIAKGKYRIFDAVYYYAYIVCSCSLPLVSKQQYRHINRIILLRCVSGEWIIAESSLKRSEWMDYFSDEILLESLLPI